MLEQVSRVAAVFGSAAALVYVLGYTVTAGHFRALGLPLRTTEIADLVGAAWELLYRGPILILLYVTIVRPWVTTVFFLLFALLFFEQPWKVLAARVKPRAHRPRWLAVTTEWAPAIIGILALALALWQLLSFVLPVMSITRLLAFPERRPLYQQFGWLGSSLDSRAKFIWDAIVGHGVETDLNTLIGLLAFHVSAVCLMAGLVYRLKGTGRRWSIPVLVVTIVNGAVIPSAYGVMITPYRYPRAEIHAKPVKGLEDEHADLVSPPRFLPRVDA